MSEIAGLVSIIMPVYNAEKFVRQAIQSVVNQLYPHWELLIINDGSTDGSKQILQSFSDKRIRYFEQNNKGVGAARNVGLNSMKGDYFCFLDADDELPPNGLSARLSVFKRNMNAVFADGKVEYYDSTLRIKKKTWIPTFHGNPLQDLLSLSGKCFLGNTWMVKKLPDTTYTFNENITHGEDLLFYIIIAKNGGEYNFTDETVLHYRTGHTSAMTNIRGLEHGYNEIYEEIDRMTHIPMEWKNRYRKKVRSIMFKSYLGRGDIFNALRFIIR